MTDDLNAAATGGNENEEVRRRLAAAAAVVDPLADALDVRGGRQASPASRRLKRAPQVALVAALCLSLALAGTLVALAGRSASPPKRIRPASPSPIRVDLAATPKGWTPVDYGDAQVSVPKSWIISTGGNLLSCGQESGVLLVPTCSSFTSFATVSQLVDHGPGLNRPKGTTRVINSVSVLTPSDSSEALVRAMGIEITWGGPLGQRILDTLTWSPAAVALAVGPVTPAPTSWRKVRFHGVGFSAPRTWKLQRVSATECEYGGAELPLQPSQIVLDTDTAHMFCGSPSPVQNLVRGWGGRGITVSLNGTQVARGNSFDTDCTADPSMTTSLSICSSTTASPDILGVETTLAGGKPMVFSIGEFGNGLVDREIYDSIRTTGTVAPGAVVPKEPGPMAIGPHGQLYFSDDGLNEVLERLPDGSFKVIAGDGHRGFVGDGGPATKAELNDPQGLAIAPNGAIYIADFGNNRVREVLPDGIIKTVAGDGSSAALAYVPPSQGPQGSPGDPLSATSLPLAGPVSLAVGPDEALWIALWNRNEVVELESGLLHAEAVGSPPPGAPAWAKLPSPACDPGSIAWSGGTLYVDCTYPFKLFSLSPNHVWTYLGVVRPHLSHSAFAEASQEVVYGLSQDRIIRIAGTTVKTFKTFDTIAGVGPFWPIGIAVAANGTIYLDQQGGGGVGPPAIISLSPSGTVHVLWAP